ncbi:MAG: hypothetical protein FVQ82_11510 [Planctomycetes bacterium]|nr:hypothetical protein [Planctomycetota bacterium]
MLKPMKSITLVLMISVAFSFIAGCENQAQTNALLGSALGAGIGAIAGGDSKGIAIGAAAGGGIGYLVGNEADKKKAAAEKNREMDDLRANQNTVTVWITNTNGSKIPVKLRKSGPNFLGPQGELYTSMPTEEQLRPVYGF